MIKLAFGLLIAFLISSAIQAAVIKSYDKFLTSGKTTDLEKLEDEVDKDLKNILKNTKEKKFEAKIDIIKTYFPYKLPMKFTGRNIYLNCYPRFDHFLNFKTNENLANWKDCLNLDFGSKLPKFHKDAFEAFNKHSY
jgi:hypothetical protein